MCYKFSLTKNVTRKKAQKTARKKFNDNGIERKKKQIDLILI